MGFMQYDTLTGLLSKQDFHDTCEKYIKEGSKKLVLISSDVSNFKYINEFYGRDTGDEFIKTMADYFYKDNPRCLAACRKGSDHFVDFTTWEIFPMTGNSNGLLI